MSDTKEKLYIDGYGRVRSNGADEFLGFCVDGFSLNGSKESQENTRRIVACWNACARSSTEWLRGCGDMLHAADCAKPLQQNIRDIATQRDDLLAALKLAEQWLAGWASAENELATIRAAIARVESK